jgi:AcrR family transcriptional regulator
MNAVATATPATVDTKTRILDAAERIFAKDGFDAASLRAITTAASVNLAAVNYHFHSKEALFSAVVNRRVAPINHRRIEMLEAITGKPTVEQIMDAFLRAPFELFVTQGDAIRPLMARMHSTPDDLYAKIMEENFAPMLNRFVDALVIAVPTVSREELHWRMFFVVGAMTQAMAWAPLIAKATRTETAGLEELAARVTAFGAAGLKAAPPRVPTSKRVNS